METVVVSGTRDVAYYISKFKTEPVSYWPDESSEQMCRHRNAWRITNRPAAFPRFKNGLDVSSLASFEFPFEMIPSPVLWPICSGRIFTSIPWQNSLPQTPFTFGLKSCSKQHRRR